MKVMEKPDLSKTWFYHTMDLPGIGPVGNVMASTRRRSAPKARKMPDCTMCRPHKRSAMPPTRFKSTVVPIASLGPSGN